MSEKKDMKKGKRGGSIQRRVERQCIDRGEDIYTGRRVRRETKWGRRECRERGDMMSEEEEDRDGEERYRRQEMVGRAEGEQKRKGGQDGEERRYVQEKDTREKEKSRILRPSRTCLLIFAYQPQYCS